MMKLLSRTKHSSSTLKETTDLDRRITVDPSPREIFIEDNDGISEW